MAFEDYNYTMINPYVMVEGEQPDQLQRKTDAPTMDNVNAISQDYDNFAVPKQEPSQHNITVTKSDTDSQESDSNSEDKTKPEKPVEEAIQVNSVYFNPEEIEKYKQLQSQDPFQELLDKRDESREVGAAIDIMKHFGINSGSVQEQDTQKKVKKRVV